MGLRNMKKQLKRKNDLSKLSTLKNRIIYETYAMYDIDGTFLCYCNKRKASFYIHKTKSAYWIDKHNNIVTKLDDNSSFPSGIDYYNGEPLFKFKLKFKAQLSGNNKSSLKNKDEFYADPYYKQVLENKCVCCGTTEYLTKHHVIPYMYRRLFHEKFKGNSHHDVLPLCYQCHQDYELIADKFKIELSYEYNVPENIIKEKKSDIEILNESIFKARNLIQKTFMQNFDEDGNDKIIPVERITELSKIACQKPIVLNPHTDDVIERYKSIPLTISDFVVNRASKVKKVILEAKKTKNIKSKHKYVSFEEYMNYLYQNEEEFSNEIKMIEENLYVFIFRWRKHFIDNAKPKFLPNYWDVFKRY